MRERGLRLPFSRVSPAFPLGKKLAPFRGAADRERATTRPLINRATRTCLLFPRFHDQDPPARKGVTFKSSGKFESRNWI